MVAIHPVYCRLSLDDGNGGESGSIQTQKIILSKYAKDNNLNVYKIYVDDGYSGLNFNRPAFNEMLTDIESGKINMVVTKNTSIKDTFVGFIGYLLLVLLFVLLAWIF